MAQSQGDNYQQRSHNSPQTTVTAPGTPTTHPPVKDELTQSEVARVTAALELGKQQEKEQELNYDICPNAKDDPITTFKKLLAIELSDILNGNNDASNVKKFIRKWYENLPDDTKKLKQEFLEAGRYAQRQLEDVIQELPVLLL